MMTFPMESFQETSESEKQAVISAQQLAIALQSDMSQEATACVSWKTEVIKLSAASIQSGGDIKLVLL